MFYVCPKDHSPLQSSQAGWACLTCLNEYPQTPEGIVLLDVVHSSEAHAFDEQQAGREALSAAEIESSIQLARRFLSVAGAKDLGPNKNFLDVGCGKGELTIGLSQITNGAKIFAFDHSSESLRVLMNTGIDLGAQDRLVLSAQDAAALGYQANQFDYIFGNAVLHHILDWQSLVKNLFSFLRPGGGATFAEPFFEGYFMIMVVLKMAIREFRLKHPGEKIQSAGLLDFIIKNIGDRTKYRHDQNFLSTLTDKHLFTIPEMQQAAERLGCRVRFEDFEGPTFYQGFLELMFKAYGIENPSVIASARSIYEELTEYLGAEYGPLFSHFKFVTFIRD